MCGIAGFIGRSKNPQVSHQIATKLFEKSEIRGADAAGFWGTESGDEGSVIYYKEPIPSTKLIKKDIWWKTASKMNLNLLVMHARQASPGSDPKWNKNNHPFVSHNKSLALVHNGKLPEHIDLRKKYETKSDTDSEVLLRVFEWAATSTSEVEAAAEFPSLDWQLASKVIGLKEIYSYVNQGWMAVALGERLDENGGRNLWLFRNDSRPIYVFDARETLGQVFFCSTYEIWKNAMRECPAARHLLGKMKAIEMPSDEIWYFHVDNDVTTPTKHTCMKFDVERKNEWRSFSEPSDKLPIVKIGNTVPIVSNLNDSDEVNGESPRIAMKRRPTSSILRDVDVEEDSKTVWYPPKSPDKVIKQTPQKDFTRKVSTHIQDWSDHEPAEGFDLTLLDRHIDSIKRLADDIRTTLLNNVHEGSMNVSEFQEHLESLDGTKNELEGTLRLADAL
jgi:predicted glutamine amidotransferase